MTGKLNTIGKDHMITNNAIVRNVRVSHQQTIAANLSLPLVFCTPVDSYTFPDGGIISYFNGCIFSYKFQILGNSAEHSAGKNSAMLSNGSVWKYCNMRHHMRIITDRYFIMNDSEGINRNIVA